MQKEQIYKVVFVGDSGVGKSCLLKRLIHQEFPAISDPTIGTDFATMNYEDQDNKIKLQFWDTAGQERFKAITRSYFRNCEAIIFVFDLTCLQSFEHIIQWYKDVEETNQNEKVLKILLGNKSDLLMDRQVLLETIKGLSTSYWMEYIECSAMKNDNIQKVLDIIIKNAIQVKQYIEKQQKKLRIMLVGDTGVGKSAIMNKYIKGEFNESHQQTIGIEFGQKELKDLKIQLWDTAGGECYQREHEKKIYPNGDVFLIVFDVCEKDSFNNIKEWVRRIRSSASQNALMILIGNKCDKYYQRQVEQQDMADISVVLGINYFECSAKDGRNINEIFDYIIEFQHYSEQNISITKPPIPLQQRQGCC